MVSLEWDPRAKSFPRLVLLRITSRVQPVTKPPDQPTHFNPSEWQSLIGGNPALPAAPVALEASSLSSDPHTSTFPADHHVQDDTVVKIVVVLLDIIVQPLSYRSNRLQLKEAT